jgi:hypothetical protein
MGYALRGPFQPCSQTSGCPGQGGSTSLRLKSAVRSHPDGLCQHQTRWTRGWGSVTTHAGRRVRPVDLRRRSYEPRLGHPPPATLLGLREGPQDAHTQRGNGPFRNVFVPRPSVLLSGHALGFAVGSNVIAPASLSRLPRRAGTHAFPSAPDITFEGSDPGIKSVIRSPSPSPSGWSLFPRKLSTLARARERASPYPARDNRQRSPGLRPLNRGTHSSISLSVRGR